MVKKQKAAPADGASTAGQLQAAWPFPTIQRAAEDEAEQAADTESSSAATPEAERIRVESLRLYTDPTNNQVEQIALEQLIESPFNPRTNYDEKALHDLAETIRGVGVMEPILARPVDYAQISHNGKPVQAYEIVFGHRRYRASKIAGEATVPVISRDLTDAQSAQLQAIENVQREDLDPLEEAIGYQHYLAAHKVTKDQLADEIGLSRTHVYSRLKLLNAVPTVQEAMRKGEIGSEVGLLIARIHTAKLQERALGAIKSAYADMSDGGKKSFRQIRELLKEKFTLDLKDAMFDIKDAQLVELAGDCTSCSKRTGNAPEYSNLVENSEDRWGHKAKGEPNLCTDPDCFEAKKKAHLAAKAALLEGKGKTVLTGGKARSAISANGEIKNGYIALKDVKAMLAKAGNKKTKGAEAVDVPVVTIQDPRTGKTHDAVRAEDLKAAGVKVKEQPKANNSRFDYEADSRRREEERQKQQAKADVDTKVNTAILAAVRQAAAGQPLSTFAMQIIAQAALRGVEYRQRPLMAQLHKCANADKLAKQLGSLPAERLTTLLLDCALVDNVVASGYGSEKPDALLAAAKHYGVDIAAIRKDVTAKAADTKTQDLLQGTEQAEEEEAEEV